MLTSGHFHIESMALVADIDRSLMSFVALIAIEFPHVRIVRIDS